MYQEGELPPIPDDSTKLCNKVAILISEDWFALSHFRPLIRQVSEIARCVVVVTRSSGRLSEIQELNARAVEFDFKRRSNNPFAVAIQSWQLRRILRRENADVVHMVAMKPIVLGGLALVGTGSQMVVHVTGQGLASVSKNWSVRLYRSLLMRAVGRMLRSRDSYLLVENSDDLAMLRKCAADPGTRVCVLGGAGVDPDAFAAQPPPTNRVPIAAHVGRMVHSKGIDLLIEAYGRLRKQGVELQLDLYGTADQENPEVLTPAAITEWCERTGARWRGHVADVRPVWRQTDMFVLASRGGEGLPRALLEAAACARPLVVTDVPGNREFVRNGVEGFLVPPGDVAALGAALATLSRDPQLRRSMGEAARRRLISGYTERHVQATLRAAYEDLLSHSPSHSRKTQGQHATLTD